MRDLATDSKCSDTRYERWDDGKSLLIKYGMIQQCVSDPRFSMRMP